MVKRCKTCGFENPKENECITLYIGKKFCDCINGNYDGKEVQLIKEDCNEECDYDCAKCKERLIKEVKQ